MHANNPNLVSCNHFLTLDLNLHILRKTLLLLLTRWIVDNLDREPTYRPKYPCTRQKKEHLRILFIFPRPTLKYFIVIYFFLPTAMIKSLTEFCWNLRLKSMVSMKRDRTKIKCDRDQFQSCMDIIWHKTIKNRDY